MEEWDQWTAEHRSIETMRRIALDAMEFKDDDSWPSQSVSARRR